MSILFDCTCGRALKVKEELAGRKIKCPHCGALMTAPSPATAAGGAKAKEPAATPGGGSPSPHEGAISIEDGPLDNAFRIELPGSGSGSDERLAPATAAVAVAVEDAERRYKVITTKELGFVSKFDASKLEDALNQYAAKGWSVRSSMRITVQAHGGVHDELVFILER